MAPSGTFGSENESLNGLSLFVKYKISSLVHNLKGNCILSINISLFVVQIELISQDFIHSIAMSDFTSDFTCDLNCGSICTVLSEYMQVTTNNRACGIERA